MKTNMSKVTGRQVVGALNSLLKQEIPTKVGYKLFGALKQIQKEQEKAEEFRKLLIEKYTQKDESGKIKVKEDNQSVLFIDDAAELAFHQGYNDFLVNGEAEVDMISIEDLGDKVTMKPADLFPLIGLVIKDDFPDEKPATPAATADAPAAA